MNSHLCSEQYMNYALLKTWIRKDGHFWYPAQRLYSTSQHFFLGACENSRRLRL